MEVSGTAENVLDLCVRKKEKEDYDDETDTEIDIKYEIDIDSDFNRNSCDVKPPLLLQQQLHKPVLTHADPNHSAALAYLQDRIYADERRQSPPYFPGDSPNSNGSLSSESLHLSPTFGPVSRVIANVTTRGGKPTRPFKAYPKETLLVASSNKDYNEFRAKCLAKVQGSNCNKNGNKNMKRPVQAVSPHQLPSSTGDVKDQAYWEKRKKNNEAAKRSRDARRAKEDELAIRTAFLEEENLRLKLENEWLKNQLDKYIKISSPRSHPPMYA